MVNKAQQDIKTKQEYTPGTHITLYVNYTRIKLKKQEYHDYYQKSYNIRKVCDCSSPQ